MENTNSTESVFGAKVSNINVGENQKHKIPTGTVAVYVEYPESYKGNRHYPNKTIQHVSPESKALFIKAGFGFEASVDVNTKSDNQVDPLVSDANPETPTSDQGETASSDSIDDIQAEINAASAPDANDSAPVADAVSEETESADQGETVEEKAKASKTAKK
ncbi:hypothetical protein [Rhizosphaericola mali]|uniref:Uncharacterized protein n=1 Tax=Rhizosphaericola mali TaxID=2545455 RepID=A0A5P2G403_9BACT|nr:hypothetical protein [Rhizosphaericola mali]QES88859.1 hypothetical protein E0W69_009395 [Rhizosphaericola mali]